MRKPSSQGTGFVYVNGGSTNNGTFLSSVSNILIAPDSPIGAGPLGIFTNSGGAIIIGSLSDVPAGNVLGNGIHIGALGSVGSNSVAIGHLSSANGVIGGSFLNSQFGAVAIGQSVECSGIYSIAIGTSDQTFVSQGGAFDIFMGFATSDAGSTAPITNVICVGNGGEALNLTNDTAYFGTPLGSIHFGSGRCTSNFVFCGSPNGAAYFPGKVSSGRLGFAGNGVGLTNCGWGGVQSNGVANSTLALNGYEEFVASMGNTIVQLGDATTNLGHHVAITCGSSGTNAIITVSSQKIAGMTKWTNTVIYSCTQLISDGSNWQICGTRGN